MALLNILQMIGASDGITITDANEKLALVARVNEAARELYELEDFPESLEEELFNLDVASQMVSLPWYVEWIRGWRYYESRLRGETHDKRNRYSSDFGNELYFHRWRHFKFSPVSRDIVNESTLTLSIPEADDTKFTVSVVGATTNAARTQETITFEPGDLTHTTSGNFKAPLSGIVKDGPCKFDITVKDAEDNTLSVIPNHMTQIRYHVIQILDYESYSLDTQTNSVEILFKRKYQELVNDYDEFLFGDKYDKAIYWKYKSHQAENEKALAIYEIKCNDVLRSIQSTEAMGTKFQIGFARNPYFHMPYAIHKNSIRRYGVIW